MNPKKSGSASDGQSSRARRGNSRTTPSSPAPSGDGQNQPEGQNQDARTPSAVEAGKKTFPKSGANKACNKIRVSIPKLGSSGSPQGPGETSDKAQLGPVLSLEPDLATRQNFRTKIELSRIPNETLCPEDKSFYKKASFKLYQSPPTRGEVQGAQGDLPKEAGQPGSLESNDLDPDGSEDAFWKDFFQTNTEEMREMLGDDIMDSPGDAHLGSCLNNPPNLINPDIEATPVKEAWLAGKSPPRNRKRNRNPRRICTSSETEDDKSQAYPWPNRSQSPSPPPRVGCSGFPAPQG